MEENKTEEVTPKKGMRKSKKIILFVCIGVGAGLTLGFVIFMIVFFVILIHAVKPVSYKTTDLSDLEDVFVDDLEDAKDYQITYDMFDILPEKNKGDVTEFSYTYYNPWDAEFLIALTVSYSSDDYKSEIERLDSLGTDSFEGIYSTSGLAPEGYTFAAMEADSYSGFFYALLPVTENNTITYCVIDFCNYFLDVDIHESFPDKYLLPGFNAEEDNPYKKKMLGE